MVMEQKPIALQDSVETESLKRISQLTQELKQAQDSLASTNNKYQSLKKGILAFNFATRQTFEESQATLKVFISFKENLRHLLEQEIQKAVGKQQERSTQLMKEAEERYQKLESKLKETLKSANISELKIKELKNSHSKQSITKSSVIVQSVPSISSMTDLLKDQNVDELLASENKKLSLKNQMIVKQKTNLKIKLESAKKEIEEINARNQDQIQTISELKASIEIVGSSNASLKENSQKLNLMVQEIESLKQSNSSLQQNLQSAQEDKNTLQIKIAQFTSWLESQNTRRKSLGLGFLKVSSSMDSEINRLVEVDKELKLSKDEVSRLNQVVMVNNRKIDSLESQKGQTSEENAEKQEDLEGKVTILLSKIEQLETQISDANLKKLQVTQESENISQNLHLQVAQLKANLEEAQSQKKVFQDQLTDINIQLDQLKEQNSSLETQISTLQSTIQQKDSKYSQLNDELKEAREGRDTCELNLSSSKNQLEQLQGQLDSHQKENQSINNQQQYSSKNSEAGSVQNSRKGSVMAPSNSSNLQEAELNKSLMKLQEELETCKVQIQQLSEIKSEYETKMEDLNSSKFELQNQIAVSKKEIHELKSSNQQLTKQMEVDVQEMRTTLASEHQQILETINKEHQNELARVNDSMCVTMVELEQTKSQIQSRNLQLETQLKLKLESETDEPGKNEYQSLYNEAKGELDIFQSKCNEVELELQEAKNKNEKMIMEMEKISGSRSQNLDSEERNDKKTRQLLEKIKSIKNQGLTQEKDLKSKIEALEIELAKEKQGKQSMKELKESLEQDIQNLKVDFKQISGSNEEGDQMRASLKEKVDRLERKDRAVCEKLRTLLQGHRGSPVLEVTSEKLLDNIQTKFENLERQNIRLEKKIMNQTSDLKSFVKNQGNKILDVLGDEDSTQGFLNFMTTSKNKNSQQSKKLVKFLQATRTSIVKFKSVIQEFRDILNQTQNNINQDFAKVEETNAHYQSINKICEHLQKNILIQFDTVKVEAEKRIEQMKKEPSSIQSVLM